jgi:hypothetical protein
MKIEAIEILKEAYGLRREGFLNPKFVSLYEKWCEITGYKNIDGKHFRFQVKEWGAPHRERDKYIQGKRSDDKHLYRVQNRMLDPENLGSGFVEKQRVNIRERMFRGRM